MIEYLTSELANDRIGKQEEERENKRTEKGTNRTEKENKRTRE